MDIVLAAFGCLLVERVTENVVHFQDIELEENLNQVEEETHQEQQDIINPIKEFTSLVL